MPFEMPGKNPPLVTNARSISSSCVCQTLNGPKAMPIEEALLRPPSEIPALDENHCTSRYSAPADSRGVDVIPKPSVNAWS